MAQPDTLAGLVRELLADAPVNHCADDGRSCHHCDEWKPGHYNRPETPHGPGCWYTRAARALEASSTVFHCSEWDGYHWESFALCATMDAAREAWRERMKGVTFVGDPVEVHRDGMRVGAITTEKIVGA